MDSLVRVVAFLGATLPLCTGCTAMDRQSSDFNPNQSVIEARNSLADRIAPGTPLPTALETLSRQGFTCQAERSAGAPPNRQICTLAVTSETSGPRVTAPRAPVSWFVTVDSANLSTVWAFDVQRQPSDPGAQ